MNFQARNIVMRLLFALWIFQVDVGEGFIFGLNLNLIGILVHFVVRFFDYSHRLLKLSDVVWDQ